MIMSFLEETCLSSEFSWVTSMCINLGKLFVNVFPRLKKWGFIVGASAIVIL